MSQSHFKSRRAASLRQSDGESVPYTEDMLPRDVRLTELADDMI